MHEPALYDPENPPAALEEREEDEDAWPTYTVIGYWNDQDEITVVGIVPGEHSVFGGDGCSEGGPWATSFHARNDDHAEYVADAEAHAAIP